LSRFLTESSIERDRTKSTGKSPGISGFFKDKMNDFKGVDPEKARQSRLSKLEGKIEELETAVKNSEETSLKFSDQVLDDVNLFNKGKLIDFKGLFREFTDAQLKFHQEGMSFWTDMIPEMDKIELVDPKSVDSAGLTTTENGVH